jgi:hypothetical protein
MAHPHPEKQEKIKIALGQFLASKKFMQPLLHELF